MFSDVTPCARIPDTRILQFMQPWTVQTVISAVLPPPLMVCFNTRVYLITHRRATPLKTQCHLLTHGCEESLGWSTISWTVGPVPRADVNSGRHQVFYQVPNIPRPLTATWLAPDSSFPLKTFWIFCRIFSFLKNWWLFLWCMACSLWRRLSDV